MITFKEFLSELFDGKDMFPYGVTSNSSDRVRANFGDYRIKVDIDSFNYNGLGSRFDVSFAKIGSGVMPSRDQSLGDALKVYNTIGDIIERLVIPKMKSKDFIQFESVVSQTKGIYERLAKKIAKEINGTYARVDSSTFRVIKK